VKKRICVVLIEHSPVISEGLLSILSKSGQNFYLAQATTFEEAELFLLKNKADLLIINPSIVQNNPRAFGAIKNQNKQVKWVGLQYCYYDPKTLAIYDAIVTISDSPETIVSTLQKIVAEESNPEQSFSQDILTERETDVLKHLAKGLANKEIADKLNISTNTVITHRKNISQKTGIKSVSGLTIFAVVQQIVSIDDFKD